MVKKTFRLADMHCANCAMKIEGLEDDLPGVWQVDASYHKLQMTIEYDESKLTEADIVEAVRKKGYTAEPA